MKTASQLNQNTIVFVVILTMIGHPPSIASIYNVDNAVSTKNSITQTIKLSHPNDYSYWNPATFTTDADTDGDGVTNTQEAIDSTDPDDPCEHNKTNVTLTRGGLWNTADCDGDGNPNKTDPHPSEATATSNVMYARSGVLTTVNVMADDDFLPGSNTIITNTGKGTASGIVSFNEWGIMGYTPASSEVAGEVTVIYQVCNVAVEPSVCRSATVTISINPTLAGSLPVALVSFTGKACTEGNELKWTTANEKGFDKFLVEKKTDLKKDFEVIGTYAGGAGVYTLTDRSGGTGNNYYRLKMVDLDGSYAYSKVIAVYKQYGLGEHIVYPNPVTDHTMYITAFFEIQDYKLYDVRGSETLIKLDKDKNQYKFNIGHNAKPGVYLMKYSVDIRWITQKIVLTE